MCLWCPNNKKETKNCCVVSCTVVVLPMAIIALAYDRVSSSLFELSTREQILEPFKVNIVHPYLESKSRDAEYGPEAGF